MAYGLWRMSDNPRESILTFPYAPIQTCGIPRRVVLSFWDIFLGAAVVPCLLVVVMCAWWLALWAVVVLNPRYV